MRAHLLSKYAFDTIGESLTPQFSSLIFSYPSDSREGASVGGATQPRKTLIICEDDPDLLRVYRLAMRSKYDVVSATSGEECLQKYSELRDEGRKVDGLLIDYRLGDTTGDLVAKKIRELNGTKVVLISAFEIDSELVNKLKSSGSISMFVKKPVTIQALGNALDNVMSK